MSVTEEHHGIKLWDMVHVDLIVPYSKYIRQQQRGSAIIRNNICLVFMTINPATGWLKISKVPMFNLDKVRGGNDDYIDKLSVRVSQLSNNTCLCRY